jgi:hypothetical protein
MALDDTRLAELLAADRDALVTASQLPSADLALRLVRLHAVRRRAARLAMIMDRLTLLAGVVIATAATTTMFLYVPPSDFVSPIVTAALGTGSMATIGALLAIRTRGSGAHVHFGSQS